MTLDQHLRDQARCYLVAVLHDCGGNIVSAARMAGRNRSDFYRLLQRHGIRRKFMARSGNRGNQQWQALEN